MDQSYHQLRNITYDVKIFCYKASFLFWGPHLAVLNYYALLCNQLSLLLGLRDHNMGKISLSLLLLVHTYSRAYSKALHTSY